MCPGRKSPASLPLAAMLILAAGPLLEAQEATRTPMACFLEEPSADPGEFPTDPLTFERSAFDLAPRRTPGDSPTQAGAEAPEGEFLPFLGRSPSGAQEPQAQPKEEPTPHGSFSGFFERHGSSRAWKEYVWEDELTQPQILIPLGLAAAAAAISHWDRPLSKHWFGLLSGRQTYSNVGQGVLIGASLLSGVFFPGEGRNSWDELWTQGEAFLASSLTVTVLKEVVARARPGGPQSLGQGTHSFPSGHSGAAFTSATLIERNSGPVAGIPAYALAGFTAFERVEAGRHYPSDVLAGAAIACLSAGIIDSLHWGSGPGRGIARSQTGLSLGFVDHLHGFQFEWEILF